ncbi:MAG: hypothetical protein J3Q66DRAFT_47995 [Benniella sp.]|nr:MAG: hypothetical protein J3Q66DRAFT_47995 [Benniella sp.]
MSAVWPSCPGPNQAKGKNENDIKTWLAHNRTTATAATLSAVVVVWFLTSIHLFSFPSSVETITFTSSLHHRYHLCHSAPPPFSHPSSSSSHHPPTSPSLPYSFSYCSSLSPFPSSSTSIGALIELLPQHLPFLSYTLSLCSLISSQDKSSSAFPSC